VPSPYFRTYWIQRNITDTNTYRAAISDLSLSSGEYREERVLLKKDATATTNASANAAAADLARLVPADAGAYQIAASPTTEASLALLETKLLAPHPGPGVASQIAPQVQLSSGETGGGGDLETRIDQAPLEVRTQTSPGEPLKALLTQNPVQASLNVQRTDLDRDKVFVRIHTAVVLSGTSEWNEAEVRSAVADFVRPTLTTSGLGTTWQNKPGHFELDGLWTLAAAVRGKYLFVSDDPALLDRLTSATKASSPAARAVFIAGFNHAAERERFVRLVNLLDGHAAGSSSTPGQSPEFFSGNIAGLSGVLAKLSSEKITVRDAGSKVMQTVTYEWEK